MLDRPSARNADCQEISGNGSVTYIVRVLIAGCGQVGQALGLRLARSGHAVWGVRRHASKLPPPIQGLSADLSRPETLRAVPPVDVLVYAASADSSSDAAYRSAYPLGLGNVLEALALTAAPPTRVLFVSTTAVYAQQNGEWVDETSATLPEHFSGLRTLEAEAVLAANASCGIAVRCGGIYGPGRTRLLDRVATGAARFPPGGPSYTNRIHLDDVVGTLAHLIALDSPETTYNCVDSDPADLKTVLEFLATQLGAPAPRAGQALPGERSRRTNKRCSNARLLGSGYTLKYPTYRDGYAALLEA